MFDVYTMQQVTVVSEEKKPLEQVLKPVTERNISREKQLPILSSFVHLRGASFTQQLLPDIPLSSLKFSICFLFSWELCSTVEMAKVWPDIKEPFLF